MENDIPRKEHPFPHFERERWTNLNGEWDFEIDNENSGKDRKLYEKDRLAGKITVPFCPESKLSGIGNTDFMNCVWYKRKLEIERKAPFERVLLHIGACDYETEVWVNGRYVRKHSGGYTPISIDITEHIRPGGNDVTIRAYDDVRSGKQPVGKQCHEYGSFGAFYTRTTGIWQTVWLETVPEIRLVSVNYHTRIDGKVRITVKTKNANGKKVIADIYYNGDKIAEATGISTLNTAELEIEIENPKLWSPEYPHLYDVILTLEDDTVKSYFGIREIAVENHKIFLNGKSIFGRFILDQGYYPDGVYTAPDDSDLIRDIELSKACGFNGARLHQKVFEPRFLYHADRMGYMVWGEFPNWGLDISEPDAWKAISCEWLEELERDMCHPCIIGWCPFNETQENQDPELIKFIYSMTKATDPSRPVIDTSAWCHVEGYTDLYDCHDYDQDPERFKVKFDGLLNGTYEGEPSNPRPNDVCFVSEFGGTWWDTDSVDGWGYGERAKSSEEVEKRYEGLVSALLNNEKICAFCYTQLTDIEQEKNGLYTYDRVPKFDIERIKKATEAKAAVED